MGQREGFLYPWLFDRRGGKKKKNEGMDLVRDFKSFQKRKKKTPIIISLNMEGLEKGIHVKNNEMKVLSSSPFASHKSFSLFPSCSLSFFGSYQTQP